MFRCHLKHNHTIYAVLALSELTLAWISPWAIMTQRNWEICKYDVIVSIKLDTGKYYTGIFKQKNGIARAVCTPSQKLCSVALCQGVSVYRSGIVYYNGTVPDIFFISPYCNIPGILDTVGCSDHPIGINQSSSTLEHNLWWGSD